MLCATVSETSQPPFQNIDASGSRCVDVKPGLDQLLLKVTRRLAIVWLLESPVLPLAPHSSHLCSRCTFLGRPLARRTAGRLARR